MPVRVEDGRGARPTGSRPFPIPAHQTGRADCPHPAFRLASPQSCRRRANMDMAEPKNTQLAIDHVIRISAGAPALHSMAPRQEIPYALVDVIVDGSIGQQPGPVTEVRRPP